MTTRGFGLVSCLSFLYNSEESEPRELRPSASETQSLFFSFWGLSPGRTSSCLRGLDGRAEGGPWDNRLQPTLVPPRE